MLFLNLVYLHHVTGKQVIARKSVAYYHKFCTLISTIHISDTNILHMGLDFFSLIILYFYWFKKPKGFKTRADIFIGYDHKDSKPEILLFY